ncbi:hypothetical protein FDC22_04840 [Clostridium botulinum]|nr:hypothetical protein [Clostridium botulinum]EKX81340.1 hypothetical protein CFSAN001628_000980 [Clostridium botulinum CFSAN001628]MBD5561546.1 hypothetical protein [Clostridium botulinum]MBD5564920.1 hypothetical protein [Clostridium botulinum]MBD5571202.1 hypothetical protein [Clostridium botulinum]MBD5575434.1 hypothetical protein [Clostridium botulinum]
MLIQLRGYFRFLNMLIEYSKYPLILTLVIDYISKPFDDEEYELFALKPEHSENLLADEEKGFNPFYMSPSRDKKEILSDKSEKEDNYF